MHLRYLLDFPGESPVGRGTYRPGTQDRGQSFRNEGVTGANRWHRVGGTVRSSWAVIPCFGYTPDHARSLYKITPQDPLPSDSDLIELMWGLDIYIFQSSPEDFLIQLEWKSHCPREKVSDSLYLPPVWKTHSSALRLTFSSPCTMAESPIFDLTQCALVFCAVDFWSDSFLSVED